jgi:hypothetical protein
MKTFGDCQSGEDDSRTESHDKYYVIIGRGLRHYFCWSGVLSSQFLKGFHQEHLAETFLEAWIQDPHQKNDRS